MARLPKIVVALLGQGIALAVVVALVVGSREFLGLLYPLWFLVLVQGALAALLTPYLGLPCWWRWIQLLLPVALFLALGSGLHPAWGLAAFVVMWLIFANASKERVPLYLTNATTRRALAELVEGREGVRFIDLGCGLGGNVAFMARRPQVAVAEGVETAPLPFAVARLWTALRGGRVRFLSLWRVDLSHYDLVYAFLSPEPMERLWNKAKGEMGPGALFVSNSFPVPGVEASEVWELADRRRTRLYIYRMRGK